jgi:cell division protein FtsL
MVLYQVLLKSLVRILKIMINLRFERMIGVFALCLIFIKIYQHNQIIKLNYEKQRLELNKNDLNRSCSDLKVELCRLKNTEHIRKIAQESWGMEKLKFAQVTTFTGF